MEISRLGLSRKDIIIQTYHNASRIRPPVQMTHKPTGITIMAKNETEGFWLLDKAVTTHCKKELAKKFSEIDMGSHP